LRRDLVRSAGTDALYAKYREQLGPWRYDLLMQIQAMMVPDHVRALLGLKSAEWLRPFVRVYPVLVRAGLRSMIQSLVMPSRYLTDVRRLDYRGSLSRSGFARTSYQAA
jgi:hypothetical protein